MCGVLPQQICHFSELKPGQFGLTKQLVSSLKFKLYINIGSSDSSTPYYIIFCINCVRLFGMLGVNLNKL